MITIREDPLVVELPDIGLVEAHVEEESEEKRKSMIEEIKTIMINNLHEISEIELQADLRTGFLIVQNKRLKCILEDVEKGNGQENK